MSYPGILQQPALIVTDGITQGDVDDHHQVNPTDIVIKVSDPDPKIASKSLDEDGRQLHSEDDQQKRKLRRIASRVKRSRLGHLARRIFVGKNHDEEELEKNHFKLLNHIKKEIRRHLSEFIGSFFIVLFIAGIQLNQDFKSDGGVANVDKGLVAGFLLTGLIYCFGNVSGAHFNPCVTLAFALRGAFHFFRAISYIVVQFGGAIAGAGVLYGIFGNIGGLGTTLPVAPLEPKDAFGVEIMITFLLITAVLTTAVNSQILGSTSGLAVGVTFAAIELFAWNLSGASANPWRTIAPTIISGVGWHTYWVYIVGPIVGTIIAVLVQRILVTGTKRLDVKHAGIGKGKNG